MDKPGPSPTQRRIRIPLRESLRLVFSYAKKKTLEQIPSVFFIVCYLIVFQVFILGLALSDALVLAAGLAMVVLGLAFFLEGLALGLMPLGETIGVKLPKRAVFPLVLAFAFLLGFGATLAEPAIAALRVAGSSVNAWEAPLLFLILNKYSYLLVMAIGLGVGIAVVMGVFRFYRGWSLKPFIIILISLAAAMTILAYLSPNLRAVTGLAWDSGGITTGPVTVPLVLALGLGISRAVGKNDSPLMGFGVVTLASVVPVITVLLLGFCLGPVCPKPMSELEFALDKGKQNQYLFENTAEFQAYVISHASPPTRLALFSGDTKSQAAYYNRLLAEPGLSYNYFGHAPDSFRRWLALSASPSEQALFYDSPFALAEAKRVFTAAPETLSLSGQLWDIALSSTKAVLPLCLFLLLILVALLRERLQRSDEVIFGICIALVGMFFLNAGIEFGLSRLGNSVGNSLPSTIKAIDLPESTTVIPGFNLENVYRSVDSEGKVHQFFYLNQGGHYREVPFNPAAWHPDSSSYDLVPQRGPLLGPGTENWGLIVLLLFGLVLGYGATMAEPALITMGRTVEEITVGIFRRKRLMQAVAMGVGIGIAIGLLKIVLNLSLIWLLLPPYAVLLVLTLLSEESYVNIAWDSAGVTTGPVTVPLVLAMGLGLGSHLGVVEGFGVLALASVYPILVVLCMGLILKRQERLRLLAVDPSEAAS